MATIASLTEESFLSAVSRALTQEIERVVAEEADAAAERVRERVRGQVSKIALGLLESYRISMAGRDVIEIRVDLTKGGRP